MIAEEEKGKGKKILWLVVIFIIIGFMFFNKSFNSKIENLFKQTEKSLELVRTIDIHHTEYSKIKSYGDIIINYDNEIITAYSLTGDKLWSKSIELEVPVINLGENGIYIGDKSTGDIVSYDLNGEMKWTYGVRQSIDKIVEKNGLLIIYTKVSENIDQINILDEEGKLLANTVVDSGRLLSSNVSLDKKMFNIVSIDYSDSNLQSSISLYTIEGRLLWKKDFNDLIVLSGEFLDNGNILTISDNKLIDLNIDGELLWRKDIKGRLKDIILETKNKEVYLLYGEDKDYIEVLGVDGKTKNKLELDNYYDSIYKNNRNIFLTGEQRLVGINGDNIFLKYTGEDKIEDLMFGEGNILLLTKKGLAIGKLTSQKD